MLLRRYKIQQRVEPKPIIEPKTVVEPIIDETVDETEERPLYTKTEINRMNKETLVNEAEKIGIEDAEELSGNVLKEKLIEYYEL